MTVVYLASDRPGLLAGELIFTFGLPATGLICLIAGLLERSRRRPPFPPPYNTGHPPPPPMGYPGPYPAPPPFPGYPPAVPPRRPTSKSATTLITVGAVLLGLGGLNIFFHAARAVSSQAERARNTSMRVGECVNESTFKAEHFTSGPENNCANPSAVYELAFKGGPSATCPDGKRDHSLYDRFTDDDSILCFAFNLKEGQCYQMPSPGAADMTMRLGDCQSHSGALQVKVVQRIDGSTDKTQCPPGDKAVSYPVPARVYCLARADS
ncbi:hypothetical protein BN000_00981 [Mycobacterium europaeum]|uniref:Uncharacterized protein n=1 Tax=Mycobacterium europaeum TaxID=761804 RepID=A0A0U1CZ39_9MYCO|nr:hypothetical protein [Mycobacterium europaeum]CQD05065.1 hypothetical protein BN000_00981 [Mycobacterium europaeum]